MFNLSYYYLITFLSNEEKEDGFYLKMIDQIKKFLFESIVNTVFLFETCRYFLFYILRLSEEMC